MAKGKKDDSTDEYSAKLDMCLTDGIVKMGKGLYIVILRLLFVYHAVI